MAGAGQQNAKMAQLEGVIRRFQLPHMAEHVLPELGARWEWVLRELKKYRLPIRPSTIATLICERVRRQGLDEESLQDLMNTLSLKSVVLNERKEWHAYTLQECLAAEEPVSAAMSLIPHRVQEALREAFAKALRAIQVDSVFVGEWLHMAVLMRPTVSARRPLHLAVLPGTNYLFLSKPRVPERLLKALTVGLGWAGAESATLHGRDLESLLRVLQQHMNGPARELLPRPPYAPRPLRTSRGVDFTGAEYGERYAAELLGTDSPRLQLLTTEVTQPLGLEPGAADVFLRISVHSDDMAATLRELVRARAIAPNSRWVRGFCSTTSNHVDLEGDESDDGATR